MDALPGFETSDMGRRLRAVTDGSVRVLLTVLDADPDAPAEGEAWVLRSGTARYLRVKVDGIIHQVTLT